MNIVIFFAVLKDFVESRDSGHAGKKINFTIGHAGRKSAKLFLSFQIYVNMRKNILFGCLDIFISP